MLIAVLSETPPRRMIRKNLLELDQLLSQYGSPEGDLLNGIVLLSNEKEELPVYLRPGVRSRLNQLKETAYDWNAAVIIPDIIQRSLFMSGRVYKDIAEVHIRPKEEEGILGSVEVTPAVQSLGFWDYEKLLLLEMLLWSRQRNLNRVGPSPLRKDKVFWIEVANASPAERYRIIKFDSPSVIHREYKNYLDVKELITNTYGPNATQTDLWKEKIYTVDEPKGQRYDLLNIIASTVEAGGSEEEWPSQTLKARWDSAERETINKVLDDTFATLEILYKAGLRTHSSAKPRLFSINEIYENFYKRHITPADCIVRCTLDGISLAQTENAEPPAQRNPYPPGAGDEFVDSGYYIDEIKLQAKDSEATDPDISLIIKKTEDDREKIVEVRLGPFSDFKLLRKFYTKGIREQAGPISVRGICESSYKISLSNSVLRVPRIAGDKILKFQPDTVWENESLTYASGEIHSNPLYFYGRIYDQQSINSIPPKSLFTWIHGDLNVGNIIVRENGEARIIDLARLKKSGPLEFDFAELETDLKIRVLYKECKGLLRDPQKNLRLADLIRGMFTVERALSRYFDEDFNPREDNPSGAILEEFQTGFLAVAQIREKLIAMYSELTGEKLSRTDVLGAYMSAIFFESVAVLNFGLDPLAKAWALVAATVACERLFNSSVNTTTMS